MTLLLGVVCYGLWGLVLLASFVSRVCVDRSSWVLAGFASFIVLFCGLSFSRASLAVEPHVKIEAIVDDKVLTSFDIDRRIAVNAFFYKTLYSGDADSRNGVLQSLIDEVVLELEAKDTEIPVSQQELDAEIEKMFAVLGVCEGLTLDKCAEENNWDRNSVISNVRSRVIWNKMLSARVVPFLAIADSEIRDYVAESESGGLETVLDLEQVFIPFKSGAVLDPILSELKKGVAIEKIASRYREHGVYVDKTVGASANGFMFSDVRSMLAKARVGDTVGPIKLDRGYLFVKLLGKVKVSRGFMNSVVDIKQLSLTVEEVGNVVNDLNVRGTGCDTFDVTIENIGFQVANLNVRVRDLSSSLQHMLQNAKFGEVLRSDNDDKVNLVMLCGISKGEGLSDEDVLKIRHNAYTEKFVVASNMLMDSIRKRHFIKKF